MILSDKQIKQLSTPPTAFIYDHGKAIPCWGDDEEIATMIANLASKYTTSDGRAQVYASYVNDDGDSRFMPMILPFQPEQVRVESKAPCLGDLLHNKLYPHEEPKTPDRKFVISYGTSSYGYDVRLGRNFKIFTNVVHNGVVDPKNFDSAVCHDIEADEVIIPPNGFLLGSTIEYFRMPRNVTGVVLGKSTYARCGVVCIATPLEAGWEGQVTLEFANTTPNPVKMYAGEGAAQVLFFQGEDCETSYADRNGKYQGQLGITLPTA